MQHTLCEMTFLDRLHRGGQAGMSGQNKYSDSFMDETDREVSTLTDRAFRSLCLGEEAIFSDAEPISSPRDAFVVELPTTFQHSFREIARKDQGLRYESLPSNGAIEATWQSRQSSSRVSSFSKGFNSECEKSLVLDAFHGEATADSCSWDKSAVWNFRNRLSEFSTYSHDPFSAGAKLHNSHCLDPTVSAAKTQKSKSNKSMFRKLSSINFFLHSEYSPFQTWEDYNRVPVQKQSPPHSSSSFHRWYDPPMYKDLTASYRVPPAVSEEKTSILTSKHRTPSEPCRSTLQNKAPAVEKRCESEMLANAPPWRRSRNQVNNHVPANRPCTASPYSQTSKRRDEALFPGSRVLAANQELNALVDEQNTNRTTPFSISQLLTPVIHIRQETDTSDIFQYEHSSHHLLTLRDTDPRSPPEVRMRDSYKAKASSLLFNLKDNRKRVKSTYSPTKFQSLEGTDSTNQPFKQEGTSLASEKSVNGLPGSGVTTYTYTEAAETSSIYSPTSQLRQPVINHSQYTDANRLDDYFTVLSPQTIKEAAQHSTFNKVIQETVQKTDRLSSQSSFTISESSEIPLQNKSTQLTTQDKTRLRLQEKTNKIPEGGAVQCIAVKGGDNIRDDYFLKENNVIRNDDVSKCVNAQNEMEVKKYTTYKGEQENKDYPDLDIFNLNERGKAVSAKVSLNEDQFALKESDSCRINVERGNSAQAVLSLKGKYENQTELSANTDRHDAEEGLLPRKESEHNRSTVTEIIEKGHVRKEVLKIQANETTNFQAPAKRPNQHVLRGLNEGTIKIIGQPQKLTSKNDEPCINTSKTIQESKQTVKQTASQAPCDMFLKQQENIKKQNMSTGESTLLANENFTVQKDNHIKHSSVSNRQYTHGKNDTADSKVERAEEKEREGRNLARTAISPLNSDSTVPVNNKRILPVEGFHRAKQSLHMTSNASANNQQATVIKEARSGKMVTERKEDGVRTEDTGKTKEREQDLDENSTLEGNGLEKSERCRGSRDVRCDVLIHEQMKMIQESHLTENEEGKDDEPAIKDCKGVAGDREQQTYEFSIIKKLDRVEKEMPLRTESQAVGNGMFTSEGKDQQKQALTGKEDKHSGSLNKINGKIKHKIFSFNQSDHALQELLTSKVKAYAQKEISAIKEKGLAKQRVLPLVQHTNHGTSPASGNNQKKPEAMSRIAEYCRSDTFSCVETEKPVKQNSHLTKDKEKKGVTNGTHEDKHIVGGIKEGDPLNTLQGNKSTVTNEQKKEINVINRTNATDQDKRRKQDMTNGEKQQAHANRGTPAILEKDVSKQGHLLTENAKVGNTAMNENHDSENSLAFVKKNGSIQETFLYREEDNNQGDHISSSENLEAKLKAFVREQIESDVPQNDKTQGLKPDILQSRGKENITLQVLQSKDKNLHDIILTGDCNAIKQTAEKKEYAKSDAGLYRVTACGNEYVEPLKEDKESVKNASPVDANEGVELGLNGKEDLGKVEEMSRQRVKDRKEKLATIEKEFVRINVFAVTREVDTDLDHCTPEEKADKEDMMKGKDVSKQEGVVSENISPSNNKFQEQVVSEEEACSKVELLKKQKHATSGTIMGQQCYRADKHETMHDEKEAQMTKGAIINVTEDLSAASVKHEHDGEGTQAKKGGDKHKEIRNKIEREGPEEDRCTKATAQAPVRSAEHAKEQSNESVFYKEENVKIDMFTVKESAKPQVMQAHESLKGQEHIASEYDVFGLVKHADVEPTDKNKGKLFKLPATATATTEIHDIKNDAKLVVLTAGEHADVPRRNDYCAQDTVVTNENAELKLSKKEHAKVETPANSHHKLLTLDAHANPSIFSGKEHGNTSMLASSEHNITEVLGRKNVKSNTIKEYVKSEVTPKTPNNTSNVSTLKEHTKPSVTIERQNGQVDVLGMAEHTRQNLPMKSEVYKIAVPLSTEHAKLGEEVAPQIPKSEIVLTSAIPIPGSVVPSEICKPDAQLTPKPGVQVASKINEQGTQIVSEIPKPGTNVTSEISKIGMPISKQQLAGLHLTAEHAKQETPKHSKPGSNITSQHISPDTPVKPDCTKGKSVTTGHTDLELPAIIDHPKLGMAIKPQHMTQAKIINTVQANPSECKTLENSRSGIPAPTLHDKLPVQQECTQLGLPVTLEHPIPNNPIKTINIKPDVTLEPHKPHTPSASVIPEVAKFPKGKTASAGPNKQGAPEMVNLPNVSVPIITDNVKLGKPVTIDHVKFGALVAVEPPKESVPVIPKDAKPGKLASSDFNKQGAPVAIEPPKQSVPAIPKDVKPVKPVSSDRNKPGAPVAVEPLKQNAAVAYKDAKPGKPVLSDLNKPGAPVTVEPPKQSVPAIPKDVKQGKPVSSDLRIPGTPVTVEPPKQGAPVIPGDVKPRKPASYDLNKPGISVAVEPPKQNAAVTSKDAKTGKPVSSDLNKPGAPVTVEPPTQSAPVTSKDAKPGKSVSSNLNKSGTPVAVEPSKQSAPRTAIPLKSSVPVTDEIKPDKPATTGHTKPGAPVAVEPPKQSAPVISKDIKPGKPVSTDLNKPGTPTTAHEQKPSTPVTDHAKPGKPVTKNYIKLDVPVTIEPPKSGTPEKAEDAKPGICITTDPKKPTPTVTLEPPKLVTREFTKQHVPVTVEHTKPGTYVVKQDTKPGASAKTEYTKTDVPISKEYTKTVVQARTQNTTSDIPASKAHAKADMTLLKEQPKSFASVAAECPAGVHLSKEYEKLNVFAPTETFSADASSPAAPLTGQHPTFAQARLRKECFKQNTATLKDCTRDETLVNLEYSPSKVVLNDHANSTAPKSKEHIQSQIHTPNDNIIAKSKVFSLPLNCCEEDMRNEHLCGEHTVLPLEQNMPSVYVSKDNLALTFPDEDYLRNHTLAHKDNVKPKTEVVIGKDNPSKTTRFSSKDHKANEEFSGNQNCQYFDNVVLSGKENINKIKDNSELPGNTVANMSIHHINSEHIAPTLPLQANSKKGCFASMRQPGHAQATRKPLHDLNMSVEGSHENKDLNPSENAFSVMDHMMGVKTMQERKHKEQIEGLQYYSISSYESEAETRDVSVNPPQRAGRIQTKGGMKPSDSEGDGSRWVHTSMDPSRDLMSALRLDASSPSLGKPSLFKVKDNTFRTSPVTKTIKPHFHMTLTEDIQLTPASTEKGEDQIEHLSENAKVPVDVHHNAILSNHLPQRRDYPTHCNLPPPDFTGTQESHATMRKNTLLEEDDSCSVASVFSEDVDSCAASTVDVASDIAGVLRKTEATEPFKCTTEKLETICTGNEGRAQGKPPVVPPKTEKALRRAQKLTTRRMKRSEVKARPEGRTSLTDIRAVSSVPSSPTAPLVLNLPATGSPAGTHFCIEPGYVSPAPNLVAQPFSLTQRKLLQDPNSGQYFVVDMPVQIKTKTFFDPETGKYVQLSVRQSPEGTLSPAAPMELLRPSYMLYPGFLPLPVASLPSLRSTSQMSAPATLDQERPDLIEPRGKKAYQQGFGRDVSPYLEPVCEPHEQPLEKPLHTENKNTISPRNLNIISMSELEDFAMEST